MKLFFETSEEFKAYYDYWVALMSLGARAKAREGNFNYASTLEKGLIDASISKAKYKIRQIEKL